MERSVILTVPNYRTLVRTKGEKMETSIKGMSYIVGLLLVVLLTFQITNHKFEYYKGLDTEFSGPTAKEVEKNLQCLALNIYREAGQETFQGKVAVAQVTINRTQDRRFPDDICGVVYQKNVIMEKVVCQFSWYCDQVMRVRPIHNAAYKESMEVAKKVYLEEFRLDSVKDALYYHANYVNPNWKYEKVAVIGNHIFYTDRKK